MRVAVDADLLKCVESIEISNQFIF